MSVVDILLAILLITFALLPIIIVVLVRYLRRYPFIKKKASASLDDPNTRTITVLTLYKDKPGHYLHRDELVEYIIDSTEYVNDSNAKGYLLELAYYIKNVGS